MTVTWRPVKYGGKDLGISLKLICTAAHRAPAEQHQGSALDLHEDWSTGAIAVGRDSRCWWWSSVGRQGGGEASGAAADVSGGRSPARGLCYPSLALSPPWPTAPLPQAQFCRWLCSHERQSRPSTRSLRASWMCIRCQHSSVAVQTFRSLAPASHFQHVFLLSVACCDARQHTRHRWPPDRPRRCTAQKPANKANSVLI